MERTANFFNQNVEVLTDQLRGREVIVQESGKRILLTSLEPWEKIRVGRRYKAMEQMTPGDLWAPPARRIRQSLIVATDQGVVGACVRLLRARFYNLSTGEFELMSREGDIANFLELQTYERARLTFLDDSENLYLIHGEQFRERSQSTQIITSEQANTQLRGLIK